MTDPGEHKYGPRDEDDYNPNEGEPPNVRAYSYYDDYHGLSSGETAQQVFPKSVWEMTDEEFTNYEARMKAQATLLGDTTVHRLLDRARKLRKAERDIKAREEALPPSTADRYKQMMFSKLLLKVFVAGLVLNFLLGYFVPNRYSNGQLMDPWLSAAISVGGYVGAVVVASMLMFGLLKITAVLRDSKRRKQDRQQEEQGSQDHS